jgi:hypothetical protein
MIPAGKVERKQAPAIRQYMWAVPLIPRAHVKRRRQQRAWRSKACATALCDLPAKRGS